MKKVLIALAIPPIIIGLVAGFIFVRQAAARSTVARLLAEPVTRLADFGSTSTLEILPLYENAGAEGMKTGHGVSYLIITDTATLLFDAGNREGADDTALADNAAALDVDLTRVDAVVISHPHPDHLGGYPGFLGDTIFIAGEQPALIGIPVYVPVTLTYPGSQPEVASQPRQIAPGVALTGTIPFAELPVINLKRGVSEEEVLAVNVEGLGIVLISGCGHPGVPAILDRAEAAFSTPVAGIVGGLHYGNRSPEDLAPDIARLQALDVRVVALSPHDSLSGPLATFEQAFPAAYRTLEVGTPLVIDASS
jgi:7,8-dihydropterin-6-yl-methyl-4-(beta-D-ribofuranosyl)aminobenzene 5'-phosphate synthase